MLAVAEDEIGEAATDASTLQREGGEPITIAGEELGAGRADIRTADANAAPRYEDTEHFAEMSGQMTVGKMFRQVMEYEEAFRQAQAVSALPLEEPIAPGQFPFLDADIGATDLPGSGRKVETVREAAAAVLGARRSWQDAGVRVRAWRLAAKAAIAGAATDSDAGQAYREAMASAPR